MLDLVQLLPHCKKDVKLDTKARCRGAGLSEADLTSGRTPFWHSRSRMSAR